MPPSMDERQIDTLLKNANAIPIIKLIGLGLMFGALGLVLAVGLRGPFIWMALLCFGLALYGNLEFFITYRALRHRGYDWIGLWQAAYLVPILGPKLRKLPPADEFLALPGAKRDVRSIVRVLLREE